MSFSFGIKEEDVTSTLSAAVDDQISKLIGPGKDEALSLSLVIPEAIQALSKGREFSSASVSGSASIQDATLNVFVTFKTEDKENAFNSPT